MSVITIVFQFGFLIVAISVHEAAHAWAADRMGDPTAKDAGRLSLNPLRHIDPFGTVIMPLLLVAAGAPAFGWAKPVPINPRAFRDHRLGMMLSALAGPASNVLLAALLGVAYQLLYGVGQVGAHIQAGTGLVAGVGLAQDALYLGVLINVFLAVFNLIPIPPLDGSRAVPVIVPALAATWDRLEQYGFAAFFVIVFLLPRLIPALDILGLIYFRIVGPVATFLMTWAASLFGLVG